MRIEKLISLLFMFVIFSAAFGQQDPQFSHNMFNHSTFNPGSAGSSNMIDANAINKIQWVGFDGAPSTTAFNINAAISPFGVKSGVGLNILSDNPGFNKDLGLNLSYAVRFKAGKGTLGVGASGGFINNSIDPKWNYPDAGTDDVIPQDKQSSVNFDLGFGLFYNTESMYFGVSGTHLNGTKMNNSVNPAHYPRQFYLNGGYYLNLPNPSWQLNPSVYIVSDLILSQFSLSANLKYNKKFWGGVSYRIGRLGEAITGMLGIELFNGLKIGYAYEFSLREISNYNDGSHEFMLGYSFSLKKERPPQQYKSIRFL
ncbi:MAG: type IX secretion system membrane protein PorP/SprF [Tenuifilaceae bacterium]